MENWGGTFLQRESMEMFIFLLLILSYFSCLVRALRPCQGSLPLRKYISM